MSILLLCGVLVLLANLGVLGLTLKLYTEYFKDRSQGARGAVNGRVTTSTGAPIGPERDVAR